MLEVFVWANSGGSSSTSRSLPDFRVDRTKKQNLIDILFIGVCTTITDMEDFATAKEDMKGRRSIRRAMKRAAYLNCSLEQILVN